MTRCLSLLTPLTLLAWQVQGQATANPPAFEVAAIKPADPAKPRPGKGRILPGGRIEIPGMTLKNLIMYAYGVEENMIAGGPKWSASDRFDIVAKAPSDTPPTTLRLMFQTLLAERFKLAIHREDKVMPAYVLTLGKRPPKYREGAGARQECNWSTLESGLRRRECHNLTMTELAKQLPGWGGIGIDLPVADQTGLQGAYDFQLDVGLPAEFAKSERRREGVQEGGRGGDAPAAPVVDSGPTIFAALDQIGLKLERGKIPMPVIVIDHAEPPTEN